MRYIYLAAIVCFTVSSCNDNPQKSTETTPQNLPAPPATSKLNEDGTKKLMTLITDYYTLKNAMVATKADDASKAATQLATSADSLSAYLQKDSVNGAATKPYLDTIITQSRQAGTIVDPTCEKQRIAFEPISSAVYGLLKKAELKNVKVYHAYCPMAFNDKGAYWLSEESEIKNPYFGKKMLECGEVTDSL